MADDEKNEMVTVVDDVWRMDVDAFAPKPDGYVTIKKVDYPIFSFLDVEIGDSLKVSRIGDDIRETADYKDRMERSIEQIMLLNGPATKSNLPVLTRESFKGVSPRQILTLTVMASSIAKVPLKAPVSQESGDANSPSPSHGSADSMGGGERSSSS